MNFESVQSWIDAGMHWNSFIFGDCMQGMAAMPEKFANLAIVDPPYGIKKDGRDMPISSKIVTDRRNMRKSLVVRNNWRGKEWDSKKPSKEYFKYLFKVSKNQVICGANNFIGDFTYSSPGWIIWDKMNREKMQSDAELIWQSIKPSIRVFSFFWYGFFQGSSSNGKKAEGNKKLYENRIHPTQKPVALYRWLLHNYAKPGDTILDTHVGSASSLIACEQMGFSYIGFEKDEDYFRAACKRMEQAREKMKQEDMFTPDEFQVKQEEIEF